MDKHVDASACDLPKLQGLIPEVISSEKCHKNIAHLLTIMDFSTPECQSGEAKECVQFKEYSFCLKSKMIILIVDTYRASCRCCELSVYLVSVDYICHLHVSHHRNETERNLFVVSTSASYL
jgi:hypothetical protein